MQVDVYIQVFLPIEHRFIWHYIFAMLPALDIFCTPISIAVSQIAPSSV